MPSFTAIYRYDLKARRNLWVNFGTEIFWGYSQAELQAMGDTVIRTIIHDDDLHLVARHHETLAGMALGQSAELFCRAWGRNDTAPRFVRFTDACVAHDGECCTEIEGEVVEVSVGAFDARKLLERGFGRQELTLHYQPICDLSTRQHVGYEALARWIRNGAVYHPPSTFLPLIEGTSLELPWVKHQISLVEAAIVLLPPPLWVSLNISESVLVSHALPNLLAGNPDPSRLHIEVLESVSLQNSEALESLWKIKASRHLIVADDIGEMAGLSRFLKQGLFEWIKLDRVLVERLPEDKDLAAITRHVLGTAADLGLVVVAEWIERPEQVDWLLRHGCQYGQGAAYGMARPLVEWL
jgi:EAL domain-containing protein (putative c-di-GMP-specific phosphodiesterase class I)